MSGETALKFLCDIFCNYPKMNVRLIILLYIIFLHSNLTYVVNNHLKCFGYKKNTGIAIFMGNNDQIYNEKTIDNGKIVWLT